MANKTNGRCNDCGLHPHDLLDEATARNLVASLQTRAWNPCTEPLGCCRENAVIYARAAREMIDAINAHQTQNGLPQVPALAPIVQKWQPMSYGAQIEANRIRVEDRKEAEARKQMHTAPQQHSSQQQIVKPVGPGRVIPAVPTSVPTSAPLGGPMTLGAPAMHGTPSFSPFPASNVMSAAPVRPRHGGERLGYIQTWNTNQSIAGTTQASPSTNIRPTSLDVLALKNRIETVRTQHPRKDGMPSKAQLVNALPDHFRKDGTLSLGSALQVYAHDTRLFDRAMWNHLLFR